jgi:RNA polymerase sigma factor (sigma-70 family)
MTPTLSATRTRQSLSDFGDGKAPALRSSRSAVEQAFIANERTLIRWLYKYIGDYETAQDIAQASFLNIWIYAEHNDVTQPKSLLFRAARNLMMNELRRRERLSRRTYTPRDETDIEHLQQQADADLSPEDRCSIRQETELILSALSAQPHKLRTAFRLHRFEDMTYKQIADRIGVSESSVGKYIMEVLRSLREAERCKSDARVTHIP